MKRVGKRKQPSYRVVVADSRSPRDGRIIEAIGHYHPRQDPSEIVIQNDRAVYWLGKGAQPSQSVRKLLQISGAWSEFTGEAVPAAAAAPPKATPAASVKATPAASVDEVDDGAEDAESPVELPEAEDQAPAAPDADTAADADDGSDAGER